MANTQYLGNKINAELDISVTPTANWKLVACITDSDIDQTRETIDGSSKCGPNQLAGTATNTANLTGFFIIDPTNSQVSMNELAAVFDSADSRHWRFIDNEGGDIYYREFNGPMTAYNESTNADEPVTFTAAIAINGDIIRTLPTT